MGNLFSVVLNMSMTGGIVILLVMLARHILKPAPKIFPMPCGLWFCSGFCVLWHLLGRFRF